MVTTAMRRTQAERRETTRQRLLEATLEALVEVGYARTTTTEIARRAGVSQGALFNHFSTKSALVGAATEALFAELVEAFRAALAREPTSGDPVAAAVRRLWDVFCHPRLRAAYLLYAEAPADEELRATLIPIVARHGANIRAFGEALFPALARPDLQVLFDCVLFAMQGASLQRLIDLDRTRERALLAAIESFARAALGGDGAAFPHGDAR
jgi:AcrR family transcriptional regulator